MECKQCSKIFESKSSKKIFCSNVCKIKYHRINSPKIYNCICDNCNKSFIKNHKPTGKHDFCSLKCAGQFKNKVGIKNIAKCKFCNKEFSQKHKRHYFCSDKCKTNYNVKYYSKKDVKCSNCGKIIQRIRHLKRKNYFCSKECEGKFKINKYKDIRICEECGKDFICKKGDSLRFCSIDCQGIWQSKTRCGKNSPTYKHEITDKMRIKKCEVCGKEMKGTPKEFEIKKFCCNTCKINGLNKSMTKPHKVIYEFLMDKNFKIENEYPIKRFLVDILIKDFNLAIEIMGTYWHSDIRFYSIVADGYRLKGLKNDKIKNIILINKGFYVLYLWEYDIHNNLKICKKLILEFIKKRGILDNYHSMNYLLENDELKLSSNILIPHFENNIYTLPLTTETRELHF